MGDSCATDYYNSLQKAILCCRPARRANFVPLLQSTIENFKNRLENEGINIARPCAGTSESNCWIFSHLTFLNRVLYVVNCELKEETPGLLTVRSLENMPPSNSSEKDTSVACIAVHWLLKEHSCLSTVAFSDTAPVKKHLFLLCNALFLSKAVRNLSLSSNGFSEEYGAQLTDGIGHMTHLNKFELLLNSKGTNMRDKHFEAMGISIGSVNTIRELTVLKTRKPSSVRAFLNGAKACTNLKSLQVRLTELRGDECLSNLLHNNPDMESIELEGVVFTGHELKEIAEELTATPLSKLQDLQFRDCNLEKEALISLGHALRGHDALCCIKMIHCHFDCTKLESLLRGLSSRKLGELCLDCNSIRDFGATVLAKYIKTGQEFGGISLKNNKLTSTGVIALLEASMREGSDTKLQFGYIPVTKTDDHKITQILEAEEVGQRVQIAYSRAGISCLAKLLRSNTFKLDTLDFDRNFALRSSHLRELFASLCRNCSVRHLRICIGSSSEPSGEVLRRLFLENKTLKSFELDAFLQGSNMILLFEGLSSNASLSRLVLHESNFDESVAHAFTSMLKSNRALAEFGTLFGSAASLRVVANGLQDNYTLLEIDCVEDLFDRDVLFDIRETSRRNLSLLNKATKFVLSRSLDRNFALAFERVHTNDSLASHLKVVKGIPEKHVKTHIERAAWYIADEYLVLSGIVRERLECFHNECGIVQLDQLSPECLRKIFSHLTLEDVRHP